MEKLQPRDSDSRFFARPKLKLFVNDDLKSIAEHRLARCVYAETLGSSLLAVESLCVMIENANRPVGEIAEDEEVFESLKRNSGRHKHLLVNHDDPKFQMCLRAVKKIRRGVLTDNIFGATRFHRSDVMPDWAVSVGSVAEIDGLSFYL
jgi:hypothetical protein